MNLENGWRKCSRCKIVFFGPGDYHKEGGIFAGICPAGPGGHFAVLGTEYYQADTDWPTEPFIQRYWTRCINCRGLFYAGEGPRGYAWEVATSTGYCPVGEAMHMIPLSLILFHMRALTLRSRVILSGVSDGATSATACSKPMTLTQAPPHGLQSHLDTVLQEAGTISKEVLATLLTRGFHSLWHRNPLSG
ncbi:hypothetical protein P3T23_009102 [Paraburkholderia sp. GAS448]